MTFYDEISRLKETDFDTFFSGLTQERVAGAVSSAASGQGIRSLDFLTLLSPAAAAASLEEMAQTAHRCALQNFGPNILLFTPLYLANHCVNQCLYCGFSARNDIQRRRLTLAEVEQEGRVIAMTGLEHLLILTGEDRIQTPVSYIGECVGVLKNHFSSISIEVYPLTEKEYAQLVGAGVDGLTIYQEVYDLPTYLEVHPGGPKRDYRFRLEAPERAGLAGMRTIGIGPLLGLHDWRSEVFFAGMHAAYLQKQFPEVEVSISLPRLRPQFGNYEPKVNVSDEDLVQGILALRLFLPRVGITISTRENQRLRDNLIRLGVTKMSAGSSTAVGGHTDGKDAVGQFNISDERSVDEMRQAISRLGYKPVLKDWHYLGQGGKSEQARVS